MQHELEHLLHVLMVPKSLTHNCDMTIKPVTGQFHRNPDTQLVTLPPTSIDADAGGSSKPLLLQLASLLTGGSKGEDTAGGTGSHPVAMILPRHGPVVKQSVTRLLTSYNQCATPSFDCAAHFDVHLVTDALPARSFLSEVSFSSNAACRRVGGGSLKQTVWMCAARSVLACCVRVVRSLRAPG